MSNGSRKPEIFRYLKRTTVVLSLVMGLQFFTVSAKAQRIVYDPTNHIENAITAAQSTISAVNTVLLTVETAMHSVIETIMARLKNEADRRMAQANLDNQRMLAEGSQNADVNMKSMMSQASQACPLARAGAAEDHLSAALNSNGAPVMQALLSSRGIGKGADSQGAAAKAAATRILCKAGLIGKDRYAGSATSNNTVVDQMGCRTLSGDDAAYINADMYLSSVLTPTHTAAAQVDPGALQYSLPANAGVNAQGFVTFSSSNDGSISSTGDELAFIAAWEYCEHIVMSLPTPTQGSHAMGVTDQTNIYDDRMNMAIRTGPGDKCFDALRYRMACPSSSASTFKGSDGVSCYQAQVAMCKFLKSPAPNGLGMDATRPSLANCETNGLSAAEFERLASTRCHDQSHVQTLYKDLDAASAEHFVMSECHSLEKDFKKELRDERSDLEHAVGELNAMRGMGSRPDITAQPVSAPTTTP
jgi:hypothetical protein